jgi:hypothetical protein
MEIKNELITKFYSQHQNINFEKANLLLIELFNMAIESNNSIPIKYINESLHNNATENDTQNDNNFDLNIKQNQLNYVPSKNIMDGELGEEQIELILNKLNPLDEVVSNTDDNIFCDFIVTKKDMSNIMIYTKNNKMNIKNNEVDYFTKSCKETKSNGIMMSQNTGIAGKTNFEIDVIGTNIVVYMHCVNYNEDKIKMAQEIIETLSSKIKLLNISNENIISKDMLHEINKEYNVFIAQKNELNKLIKDYQTKLNHQINDIKFNNLSTYLNTKFVCPEKAGIHKCGLCNVYTSNTLKGLAAHKRGCKKKVHQP